MDKNTVFSNKIFNEDCIVTMERMINEGFKVDSILTSPPYNMTSRKGGHSDTGRYDVYKDWKTEEEYIDWMVTIFNNFDKILNTNRAVLFNFSYSIENPSLPYKLVVELEKRTPFKVIDTIIWKKKSGLPFPANNHRLSRIYEFVFVFTRKDEMNTYENRRKVSSVSKKTGQKYYEVSYNFVEAPNNDGKCELNQATFSSDLCRQLMEIYVKDGWTVYDPFMGSGTTAYACKSCGINYVGSEISTKQCEYAKERLNIR